MRDLNPKQAIEKISARSAKDTDREIAELKKSAKENADLLEKMDVSTEDVMAIPKLKASAEPEKQAQGLYAVEQIIGGLMARLKEKKEDIDLTQLSANTLSTKAASNGIKVHAFESAAIQKYNELTRQGGPTGQYLMETWQEIAANGEEKGKKWTEELRDMWERDKAGTIGLLAVGAVGAYLGYKAIKGIWGWMTKDETPETLGKGSEKGFFENLMPSKKTMGLLGILLLGMFLGRGELKKLLYAKMGIKLGDADLDDLVNKAKEGKMDALKRRVKELEAKGKEGAKSTLAKGKEKMDILKKEADFDGPISILIALHCLNERRYQPGDKAEILNICKRLKETKIGDIAAFWEKFKDMGEEGAIPNDNELMPIGNVKPENIYTAFNIIASAYYGLQKSMGGRFDYGNMLVKDFVEKHLAEDPAHKINTNVQEKLKKAIATGSYEMVELKQSIKKAIHGNEKPHEKGKFLESLSKHLGIETQHLTPEEKRDFRAIAFKDIFRGATLSMETKDVLSNARAEGRSINAILAAEKFFETIKKRTLENIIPSCIKRFELPDEYIGNPKDNSRLLQRYFDSPEPIAFSDAVYLNVVSKNIDFKNPEQKIGQPTQLALLYTLLNTVKPGVKNRYLSELAYVLSTAKTDIDIKLPDLAVLKPYFNRLQEYAKQRIENTAKTAEEAMSPWFNELPLERRKQFLKEIAKADFLTFAGGFGQEAVRGSIIMTKDAIAPFRSMLNVSDEEWKEALDGGWTAMLSLALEQGGALFFSREEPYMGIIQIGAKHIFFKPIGAAIDAIKAWADGDIEEGLKVWVIGASPYIAIGTTWGAVAAKGGVLAKIKGGAFGLGKGLLAPGRIPIKGGAKGIEWIYRATRFGKEKGMAALNVLKYRKSPSQAINLMLRDAKMLRHYYSVQPLAKMGKWKRFKYAIASGAKKEFSRLLMSNWNLRMMEIYANRFAFRYLSIFGGLERGESMMLTKESKVVNIEKAFNKAKDLDHFISKLVSHPEFKNADSYQKLKPLIEKFGGILGGPERDYLLQQLKNNPGYVKKFIGMMTDGSQYLSNKEIIEAIAGTKKFNQLLKQLAKQVDAGKIQKTLAKKGVVIDKKTAELIADTKDQNKIKELLSKIETGAPAAAEIKTAAFYAKEIDEIKILETRLQTEMRLDIRAQLQNQIEDIKKGIQKSLKERGLKAESEVIEQMVKGGKAEDIKQVLEEGEKIGISEKTESRLARLRKAIGEKAGRVKEYAGRTKEIFTGPRLAETEIAKLVKTGDIAEIQKLLNGKGLKAEGEIIEQLAKAKNADEVKLLVREIAKNNGKIIKFISKVARAGKVLKIAKPLVPITMGAAAFIEAGTDFYQAATTENMRKKENYIEKGSFNTVAGGIEVGAMIGYGAFSTAAFWAGMAAAPWAYITNAGYESAIEADTTTEEWVQSYDHPSLIHHWISTGKAETYGNLVRMTLPMMTPERLAKEFKYTRKKIAHALVIQEGNRFKNDILFRQDFLEERGFSVTTDFEAVKKILFESKLYSEVMHARSIAKERPPQKEYPKIAGVDILNPKFNPSQLNGFERSEIAKAYQKEALKNVHPVLAENFKKFETGELLDFYMDLDKYLSDERNEVTEDQMWFRNELKNYLTYGRNVDPLMAAQANYMNAIKKAIIAEKGELPDDTEELQEAQKKVFPKIKADYNAANVEQMIAFFETGNKALEIKNEKVTDTDACHALYKLAQFFGYTGLQNEEQLKDFFDEDHSAVFGIYWDGDEWTVTEAGYELDNDAGDELSRETIKKMIQLLREDPENILEHRQESLLLSPSEIYKGQVLKMANILEKGLNEYDREKKARGQAEKKPAIEPAKEESGIEAPAS